VAALGFVVAGTALTVRRSLPILVGAVFVAVMVVQAGGGRDDALGGRARGRRPARVVDDRRP
jgi:hypothetical protein